MGGEEDDEVTTERPLRTRRACEDGSQPRQVLAVLAAARDLGLNVLGDSG